jgi:alkylhydroperoxidase/carboxymuconolactone decarboxylase family protein YurZ
MAIPKRYKQFQSDFPKVAQSYERLGDAIHKSGPLSDRERSLVKLAISIGAKLEGGMHAHTRKALNAGATKEDLYHVALLSLQTIGLPSAMAAMSAIDDIVKDRPKKKKR